MSEPAITIGSLEWLKKVLPLRVLEHRAAQAEAIAQANAHSGAAQACQRLLDDLNDAPEVQAE